MRVPLGEGKNEVSIDLVSFSPGITVGTIDLSEMIHSPEMLSRAKYEIRSFIVHEGPVGSGHYLTFFKLNDEYYCADDRFPEGVKKITKEQFFGRKDSYLIILEQLISAGNASCEKA